MYFLWRYDDGNRIRNEVKSHFRHLGAYYDHSSNTDGEIFRCTECVQVDKNISTTYIAVYIRCHFYIQQLHSSVWIFSATIYYSMLHFLRRGDAAPKIFSIPYPISSITCFKIKYPITINCLWLLPEGRYVLCKQHLLSWLNTFRWTHDTNNFWAEKCEWGAFKI